MGAAHRALGQKTEALGAYERYLQRLPNGPRASIAQHQVERLREELRNEPTPEPAPAMAPTPTEPSAPTTPEPAVEETEQQG